MRALSKQRSVGDSVHAVPITRAILQNRNSRRGVRVNGLRKMHFAQVYRHRLVDVGHQNRAVLVGGVEGAHREGEHNVEEALRFIVAAAQCGMPQKVGVDLSLHLSCGACIEQMSGLIKQQIA